MCTLGEEEGHVKKALSIRLFLEDAGRGTPFTLHW